MPRWSEPPPLQPLLPWGALQPWQGKQDCPEVPPVKPEPWQDWQVGKPGEVRAAGPCWPGFDQPGGWPPPCPWQRVLLKHPGAVPAGAGGDGGAIGELAPFAWHCTQTGAFEESVEVC